MGKGIFDTKTLNLGYDPFLETIWVIGANGYLFFLCLLVLQHVSTLNDKHNFLILVQ